ncbi:MAG TPA: hypothetical protein VF913_14305 [Xanthobacteraceae bacterium]
MVLVTAIPFDELRRSRWRKFMCAAPPIAALVYPAALFALHLSFGRVRDAVETGERLLGACAVGISLLLTYGIPVLAFIVAYHLGRDANQSSRGPRITAHLAVASPPLFTMIGVGFYMAGIANGDYVLWGLIWIPAAILTSRSSRTTDITENQSRHPRAPALRTAHGISAAAILLIFLVPHIANHLTAIWSIDGHKTVMRVLRHVYRTDIVQPLLLALVTFQIASGVALWRARMRIEADLFGTMQTAAGIYLAVFIVSHLIAVFVLGRMVMKVDTDFLFASGAPTGLLYDAWNVRLIPHYSLAVWALFVHLACGLRVLLSHGISISAANRFAWSMIGLGAAVAATIILSMCGLHIRPQSTA